jgi:protein TonB
MDRNARCAATACLAALLASCSEPPRAPEPSAQPQAVAPSAAEPPPPPGIQPLTLEGYKKAFAEHVARASTDLFDDPLPEVLKSIVVLEIAIGRDGQLQRVAVRRSNGFRALETRAMDNVRRAAPFLAPARSIRRGDGSVNFLETFLFRDDGRFQIRSLVAAR